MAAHVPEKPPPMMSTVRRDDRLAELTKRVRVDEIRSLHIASGVTYIQRRTFVQ